MKMISKLQPPVFLIIIATIFVSVTAQMNLALHGTVAQETTYTDAEGISYTANLAIEGPANNNWEDGCSATDVNQKTAWWGLLFPKLVYVTNVKRYNRKDEPERMNDFRLYFTNDTVYAKSELCYRDTTKQAYLNLNQSIDCDLSPTMNVYFFNRFTLIELCYVEIYGCWKGFWGENCTVPCPPKCIDQHCYPANGNCVWGCDPTNCMSENCYTTTGVCLGGCVLGRAGQYCNKYNLAYNQTAKIIPVGQTNASLLVDGLVSTCNDFSSTATSSYLQVEFGSLSVITTVHIVFGGDQTTPDDGHAVYCSNATDTWKDGTLLYSGPRLDTDITIFAVCKYLIYVPPMLSGDSMLELCEIEIGGCPYRRYGVNCEHLCSEHCLGQGQCDLVSGSCLSGCSDGWVGEKCDKECSPGLFGSQCLRNCSKNCLAWPCNHVTGECDGGCKRGWERLNCTDECSRRTFGWNCSEKCDGCIEDSCDHMFGVCKNISGCKPGYEYGRYCNKTCADWYFGTNCTNYCNCRENPCDRYSGQCSTEGCKRGWYGVSCDQECMYGYFGFNCEGFCANCLNESCSVLDGNCTDGCSTRYSGDLCDIKELSKKQMSPSDPGPAIGGVIGAIVIVIIAVIIAVIIYRRRSASRPNKYLSDSEHLSGTEENTYINHDPSPQPLNEFVNKGCEADLEDVGVSLTQKHASKTSGYEGSEEIPEEYEDEYEGNVYGNVQTVAEYKISIADLKKVINEKQKDDGFKKEYDILPRGLVHAHVEGSKEENKIKNRFLATWPYDHSRIVLTGDTKSDYINASFIDSYEKEKAYIASQGPKRNTIRDFWHMIWQEKVNKIVMVTKLEEERRKKCEQYWPQNVNRAMLVDNYKLTMREEIQYTVYVYRLIILHNKTNQQERTVRQFHFTQWPDHGVPDSIKLVKFYRKVRSEKCDKSGPTVVHCSAGVGRTGTFIAVDALYEHGKKVGHVDIMEYVHMMRKDRMNMIQTHEQYEIVFEALLELFTVPDTSIQKNDFCGYIEKQQNKTLPKNQTMYSEEFQRLRTLRPSYSSNKFTGAKSKENQLKNSTTVLAHDQYRPYLMSYGKNRSDYINAVIIPCYSVDSKMFVTQCPLVETVIDFWTMMYDHSSRIIVLLDPGNKGAPLWLEKKEMLQFDDFRIIKETENAQEEIQLTLNHTKNKEKISINVFTANDWTISNAPLSPEYMLDLLQRVQSCWETHKGPITVVCRDGCSKSGLFVALRLVLEKMQIDEETDIFQVVREIQIRRPEFLVDFDQYEYCYKCVRLLLEGDSSDSLYANV
ncbi:receptor-type tyrosine-protein phosphatase mu-like isoform X2 [Mytilus californianus]|uniref:receptor-type tyrosine-protein phosphatase mu-like isoform X2 n=1 Tax=Mytilus californianus TaxID=6549 RepID=UPI002246C6F8|nr:receptor-type tyrosine-protein phosphatase mu-like isoform X2 [Mytilus californianus]